MDSRIQTGVLMLAKQVPECIPESPTGGQGQVGYRSHHLSHEASPESGTQDGNKDTAGDCSFDFFNIHYASDTLGDVPSCYATRQKNLNILPENSSLGESCLSPRKTPR